MLTVVTVSDDPYQFWQVELLHYSMRQVGQPGDLICLVAQKKPGPLCGPLPCPHIVYPTCSPHPVTGDDYAPYNKPGLLRQWVRYAPDDQIHLVDPDCIFTTSISEAVQVGRPRAQQIWFMDPQSPDGSFIVRRHCRRNVHLVQPLAVPIFIHREDLSFIVDRWMEATEQIRSDKDSRERMPWVAEMWGYVIAAAEAGLVHQIEDRQSLTDNETVHPIVHYSYGITAPSQPTWKWDKRHYRPWSPVQYPTDVSRSASTLFEVLNRYAGLKAEHSLSK